MHVILFFSVIFILSLTACSAPNCQVTVKVVEEDTGKPISEIPVHASTFIRHLIGPDGGGVKRGGPTQKTDLNGVTIINMKSIDGEIGFVARYNFDDDKKTMLDAGYYEAKGIKYKGIKIENGKWLPWNPTLTIKIKRVIKPIPMYAKHVETKIPEKNKPCGYDLIIGDWVVPYGKGKTSDFIFIISKKMLGGEDKNGYKYFFSSFCLHFHNDKDGIQSVFAKYMINGSPVCGLRLPYQAPINKYANNTEQKCFRTQQDGYHKDNLEHSDPESGDQNYFFRVRSENKYGMAANSLYGKIHGDFKWGIDGELEFTYYLNPTPNDRNVEFDPDKNLFGKPSCVVGSDQSMAVGDP